MRSTRFLSLGGMVGLTLLALAGCGSSAAAKGSSPTATATCPPAPKVTAGTLATVSGSQLTIKDRAGQQVVVHLTASTIFTEQKMAAQSDLQDGQQVQVQVTSNSDGTYTAVRVFITTGTAGNFPGGRNGGGQNGGNQSCRTRSTGGRPTPTGGGRTGGGQPGTRGLSGTIATINGQTMTITTQNGADFTITLDSSTRYNETISVKASDLQVGQNVSVSGRVAADGSITAQSVSILLMQTTG